MSQDFLSHPILTLGDRAITGAEAVAAIAALAFLLLLLTFWQVWRASRSRAIEAAETAERQRELDDKIAAMNQLQAEMTGRMQTLAEVFGARQSDFAKIMADRLDSLRGSVHSSLAENAQRSSDNLGKLNERLAVIDAAQADLKGLTSEVLGLKDVLSNKQARGAYGQGRMEAIVRDALPPKAYDFQPTLSNRARPDCVIHLPGDDRPLVIDAKFPLEGFSLLRDAKTDEARAAAERRVRADLNVHLKDIAEKYLIPGETQDLAMMFVPAESIHADLMERFEDVVQRAHKARVLIVSPSLLMMAIQVAQAIVRDAAIRESARVIQLEVGKLLEDVRRLSERATKLETHFRQAQEDVAGLLTSADKAEKRAGRIGALDFSEKAPESPRLVSEAELPPLPLKRQA
jgi:DNA recombination protein RmuC